MKSLSVHTLDDLVIDDEAAFKRIPLYAALKDRARTRKLPFRVLNGGGWDRALLLNLTFWGDGDGDILVNRHIAADVVTHAAWHDVAAQNLAKRRVPHCADALLFGESIASAFDVYLVGTLLASSARSSFLETHVEAMADTAKAAGLNARGFRALLATIAADPSSAFEELRALLFDVATDLVACNRARDADAILARAAKHRYGPLLHQYALSTWVLYVRAFAPRRLKPQRTVRELDATLRKSASLDWLASHWLSHGDD